jgi:hypothetical protein
LVSTIDILPTLKDATGVKESPRLDGRSLLPLLKGEANVSWRDAYFDTYPVELMKMNIPPSTTADANTKRRVNSSESRITPPIAAIIGTLNCTVAEVAADSPGSTEYHKAYPTPDAKAPEAIAKTQPSPVADSMLPGATKYKISANGTDLAKLPAVANVASEALRPRSE